VCAIFVVAGRVARVVDFERPHLGVLQQCVPVSSEDKVGPVMLTKTQVLRLLSITLPLFLVLRLHRVVDVEYFLLGITPASD
jgi:hypothetical protein